MKNILHKISLVLLVSSALLVSSCAELFDCIAKAQPDIHSKVMKTGFVGTAYNDFIEADVTNDPNDNDYDYFYSITGNLPVGMSYFEQGRRVYLNGVPTVAGTYTFRVRLTIDPPNYEDYGWDGGNRICFGDDTTTKEFTITVQ